MHRTAKLQITLGIDVKLRDDGTHDVKLPDAIEVAKQALFAHEGPFTTPGLEGFGDAQALAATWARDPARTPGITEGPQVPGDLPPLPEQIKNAGWFCIIPMGRFNFRFGPFKGQEIGPIMERCMTKGIPLILTGDCGTPIDWDIAGEAAKLSAAAPPAAEPAGAEAVEPGKLGGPVMDLVIQRAAALALREFAGFMRYSRLGRDSPVSPDEQFARILVARAEEIESAAAPAAERAGAEAQSRSSSSAASEPEPVPAPQAALQRIVEILARVETRAAAHNVIVPVEITDDEVASIYALAKGHPEHWRPRG